MIKVPDDRILALPYDDFYAGRQDEVFVPLRGKHKRAWFSKHAYLCLPLVIGNQYGFAVKSLFHATFLWNGGPDPKDTTITVHNEAQASEHGNLQLLASQFGLGIVTVQTAFALRTPPEINLMTLQPPNAFIDGLQNMMGVVEADNLRRDFTFNLKITRPHFPVEIKVGDLIAAVLPIPRGFVEKFELIDAYEALSPDTIAVEQQTSRDFGREREDVDSKNKRGVGRRYFKGEDVYGRKFEHSHQQVLTAPDATPGSRGSRKPRTRKQPPK
jgi:hypothetical protein